MINIDSIELSKNTVNVNETIIIKVKATEIMATWEDLRFKTWEEISKKTWEQIRRKIF